MGSHLRLSDNLLGGMVFFSLLLFLFLSRVSGAVFAETRIALIGPTVGVFLKYEIFCLFPPTPDLSSLDGRQTWSKVSIFAVAS